MYIVRLTGGKGSVQGTGFAEVTWQSHVYICFEGVLQAWI